MSPDFSTRVRIEGTGPVALALALLAVRQGVAVSRLSVDLPREAPPAAVLRRALAMSLGSWQLLQRIIDCPPSGEIRTVDVALLGQAGRTRLRARELGVAAVGHVVRYGDLLDALARAAQRIGLGEPASHRPDAWPLVIHAEGQAGDDARTLEFSQEALLFDIETRQGSDGTAWERFTAHGPLAVLPLPDPRRLTVVWCDRPDESRRRAALEAPALADELAAAFPELGPEIVGAGPASCAPLVRRLRRAPVRGHEVWIGNAAQTLHPVAGQGLNLGLRDAFELSRLVAQWQRTPAAGVAPLLARYARRRRLDRGLTVTVTDALARAFAWPWLQPVQSLALDALDLSPSARSWLAQRFMFGFR